jgi:PGF-CTERM protein
MENPPFNFFCFFPINSTFVEYLYCLYVKIRRIKMKMSNLQIVGISAVVLVLSLAVIGTLPVTAADEVSVTRELPDTPVNTGDNVTVTLNQNGFYRDTGVVTEILPEGFIYVKWSAGIAESDAKWDSETNELKVYFEGETTITYIVTAGTTEDAEFSGTWTTVDEETMAEKEGTVGGNTNLTLAGGPTPTPTPTPTITPSPSNSGGNGGGGNGGGTLSTPTSSPTPTASPGAAPTVSPGETVIPTVSPIPTPSPTLTPTPKPTLTASPARQQGIPGFEVIVTIAALLAIAYLELKRDRKV